jgi:hypothetical protein
MIKIICIEDCWNYKFLNHIKVDSVYYTPIVDMNEPYTNWISIYQQDDMKTYIGTYNPKYFYNLALLRENRINSILND